MKLTEKRCVPCEAGALPFTKDQIKKYLKEVSGWKALDAKKIVKEFKFKSYPESVAFAVRVALIAQDEGHHPAMTIHYSKVVIELWTHAILGLSENDFILAAKIDE